MSQDKLESHDGYQSLIKHLEQNAAGAQECIAEGRLYSANEELFVARQLQEMSMSTDLDDLTPERVELTSRLAWALSELRNGESARIPDDLEHVDELVEAVY